MGYFDDQDSYLFHEGTNYESYKKLGAHPGNEHGLDGTWFSVWAPNAQNVSLITSRMGWEYENAMHRIENGVWEVFLPHVGEGDAYRFVVTGADGTRRYKADPYAFRSELRPANASIVCSLDGYEWGDGEYQATHGNETVLDEPMAVYEVHLGSWKKGYVDENDEDGFLNYRQLADDLAEYVTFMGYTHVELMGICEYPFDLSWGYQVTGYFAPTARYGVPDDFRYLVDKLHQSGIGVILDWVPAHYPKDEFALTYFDGTPLYESPDPLRAEYPEWGTMAFDFAKPEVRSFLISSAFYWIREFHVDALRVDAVAAMIYNSYSRSEWRPNMYGGNQNLEAIDFMRQLNSAVTSRTPGYLIAEDSSAEWGVTSKDLGIALGFALKWNMGWMNDTLRYIGKDPIYRQHHHELLVHTIDYAFSENYVLVLSHDEVVYGKKSLVEKSPGGVEEKCGCLKTLLTHQIGHPGKKLLFMGQDFAQNREWSATESIDWHLTDDFGHRDIMETVRRLLYVYKAHPVLYSDSQDPGSFEWVNRNDFWRNTISYIRRNPWNYEGAVLVVCNFSPMQIDGYAVGVPLPGGYRRVFSTYDSLPDGGGPDEVGAPVLEATREECDGREYRLTYDLRPYESLIIELP